MSATTASSAQAPTGAMPVWHPVSQQPTSTGPMQALPAGAVPIWLPVGQVPVFLGNAPFQSGWRIPLRNFHPEDFVGMDIVIQDIDGVRWAEVSAGSNRAQFPWEQPRPWRPVLHVLTLAEWQIVPWAYTVVDCKVLHDPASLELRSHAGIHPGIVDAIVEHAEFPKVLAQVKAIIRGRSAEDSPHVALQCKSGKHRSVAVGALLQYLLGDDYAIHLQHYNFSNWGRDTQACMRGQCSVCLGQRPTKLDEASRQWNSL